MFNLYWVIIHSGYGGYYSVEVSDLSEREMVRG